MAGFGAKQKLTLDIGGFRFCPEAVIQSVAGEGASWSITDVPEERLSRAVDDPAVYRYGLLSGYIG
jgi:hypothetical protein